METNAHSFLARERIPVLMRKYSLPCVISLLVGALYNIVDQIFIANASYLGSYGNAANTVVFPLTVIALAIAVMIGDGCCAFVSICLGRQDKDTARLTFGNAVVLGILCNVLVCIAVAMSLMSKNTVGRAIGAYLPIAFFVIAGFEHSVANMYYISAGLFAKNIPAYVEAAAAAGLDISGLTWFNFLVHNLLPVTVGNIIGGCSFAALLWFAHGPEQAATPVTVRMVPHETVKKTAS